MSSVITPEYPVLWEWHLTYRSRTPTTKSMPKYEVFKPLLEYTLETIMHAYNIIISNLLTEHRLQYRVYIYISIYIYYTYIYVYLLSKKGSADHCARRDAGSS